MKLAMISRTLPARCGIAEYVSMLSTELRKFNDIDIVLLGNVEEKDGLRKTYPEPYSGVRTRICFSVKSFNEEDIIRCILEERADIVYIQHEYSIFPQNDKFIAMIKKLKDLGVKVIVTMHTVVHALKGIEYVEFQRALGRWADAVIVHSILQEYELVMQGVDPRKIFRIPHGTLLNPFVKIRKSEAMRKLGLELDLDGYTIISTPGFIRRDKGLDILLKAYEIVKRRYDVKLIVLGEPQFEADKIFTIDVLSSNRHGDHIVINKFLSREELLLLLNVIDIAVFPYRDEYHLGVSGAFHLAIGSFKEVVCTRAPRLVECYSLAPSVAAPLDSAEEIAKRICRVLEEDPDVVQDLKNLHRYAIETTWSRVAEMHRKLYLHVLEQ